MTATDYRHKNYRKIPFPEPHDLYILNTEICGRVLKKPNTKDKFWIILWDMLRFEGGIGTATVIIVCFLY
jgi:hypothetical protein